MCELTDAIPNVVTGGSSGYYYGKDGSGLANYRRPHVRQLTDDEFDRRFAKLTVDLRLAGGKAK